MKRVLVVSLIFCLSIFAVFALNSNAEAETGSFNLEEKVVKKDKKFIHQDLSIPVIKDLGNKPIQKKLNDRFEENIMEFANKLSTNAQDFFKEAEDEGWKFEPRPYAIKTNYQLRYHQNNILSLTIWYYQYTGGAHGNYWLVSHNLDLNTGEELPLTAFVNGNENYKDIINDEIKGKIESEEEGGQGVYFKDSFKGISDNPQFYLEDDYIVIYFDLYEIAPYSNGIPKFKIQRSLF